MYVPSLPVVIPQNKALYRASQMYLDYQTVKEDAQLPQIYHFDSRKRDLNLYPYASDFVIDFPVTIQNINKVELIASEFSNSSRTISNIHNSEISWINGNEASINFPVYTVQISYGVYTLNSIQSEIVQKMSSVPRLLAINNTTTTTTTPINHNWQCIPSTTTPNGVTFYNIIYSTPGSTMNPFSTTQDSALVTVTQTNHSHQMDDLIFFNNVTGDPGGIASAYFNTSTFTVNSIIDANTFTIIVDVIPYDSGVWGGNAQIGTPSTFRFVTPPHAIDSKKTLLSILGFPPQSSIACNNQFTLAHLKELLSNTSITVDNTITFETSNSLLTTLALGTKFHLIGAETYGITADTSFIIDRTTTNSATITTKNLIYFNSARLDQIIVPPLNNRLRIFSDPKNENLGISNSQSNIFDSGSTYKSVDLSGESFCFLVCPDLENAKEQLSSANISNILTKIQLIAASGNLEFNTKLSYPVELKQPISLDSLHLQLFDADGKPVYYDGLSLGGTLMFTQEAPDPPFFLLK